MKIKRIWKLKQICSAITWALAIYSIPSTGLAQPVQPNKDPQHNNPKKINVHTRLSQIPSKKPTNQKNPNTQIDTVTVHGRKLSRDQKGKNQIYNKNYASEYLTKEYIERYKGANSADIFKGMVGVQSSDARNSGAIVPNIRGMQDFGKIAVTIDGTEQSNVANRGAVGISTRSFIDPMLIGNMKVIKGGIIDPEIKTGTGGAVVIKTLEIDDIVPAGQKFGLNIKLEASNNATSSKPPPTYFGGLNKDLNWPIAMVGRYFEFNSRITPKIAEQNKFSNFSNDYAYRIASGWKEEKFDVLLAIAERNRGNYFAGKKGVGSYLPDEKDANKPKNQADWLTQTTYKKIANLMQAGMEIPNTSSHSRSQLFKFTIRPTSEHTIDLGLQNTNVRYGDLMPFRLEHYMSKFFYKKQLDNYKAALQTEKYLATNDKEDHYLFMEPDGRLKLPQWPLSQVHTSSAHINYRYQPDNPLIDFKFNLWGMRMKNNTNNSGASLYGFYLPEDIYNSVKAVSSLTNDNQWSQPWSKFRDYECAYAGTWKPKYCVTYNAAAIKYFELRHGAGLSNTFELKPELSLNLFGNYQYEKVYNRDHMHLNPASSHYFDGIAPPRAGRYQTYNLGAQLNWQTTSWLELQTSVRYNHTWSFDDYLKQEAQIISNPDHPVSAALKSRRQLHKTKSIIYKIKEPENNRDRENSPEKWQEKRVLWSQRADGQYYLEDNPLFNGTTPIDTYNYAWSLKKNPKDPDNGQAIGDANPELNYYGRMDSRQYSTGYMDLYLIDKIPVEKRRWHGWSADMSAAIHLSDDLRLYGRYSSIIRAPSLFETTSGFGSLSRWTKDEYIKGLKPERSNGIEAGISYNLADLLKTNYASDIKLNYYYNKTTNIIGADYYSKMTNSAKQILSGLELQSRYDNGRFFGELSYSLQLKNKVCDPRTAIELDPYLFRQQSCVNYGFDGTMLRTAAPPKQTAALHLGSRWLNEKLELGVRTIYHSKSPNIMDDQLASGIRPLKFFPIRPISWSSVVVIDAYMGYKISDNINAELVGSNLTNRYYLDPITRTMVPAPGRTIRLGLQAKF